MSLCRISPSISHFIYNLSVRLTQCNRRQKALLNPVTDSTQPSPHIPTGPKKDYSLKEGQTFSISIPGHAKATAENDLSGTSASSSGSGFIPLLPPPPGVNRKK